jgi:hypothetical protein
VKRNSPLAGLGPILTFELPAAEWQRCQVTQAKGQRRQVRYVEEIVSLTECQDPVRQIVFEDDTFAADPERTARFCERLLQSGIRMPWFANLRVDTVNTARRVLVGWTTDLRAMVSGQGTRGNAASAQLLRDGKVLQETPVWIPDRGGAQEVSFQLTHPDTGVFIYTVLVPPL